MTRRAPIRILYVEDHDELRESIALLLEGPDREVVPCASSEEALAQLDEQRYDVLVTDVSLPGLSGTDLARRVLARDPQFRVVLMSGYELNHGLDRFGPYVWAIAKPFEIEDLEALLATVSASLREQAT